MYLCHHGIKGQKWGVRRYQYADGSLTNLGRKRRAVQKTTGVKKQIGLASMKASEIAKNTATKMTGKQYVDTYLDKNTNFNRIQTSKNFEKFAFYATYKKDDSDKYMGLFGKNLTSRAAKEADIAEKIAKKTGTEEAKKNAEQLRQISDNIKVYQLSISAMKKLKVPSDDNASSIMETMLKKDKQFKDDLIESINDSKTKMLRPSQQILFNQAQKAMQKETMSKSERIAVYKAFNLSLVHHNDKEIRAQNTYYSELKKKGYNALLDHNDKSYSSYHSKRPMIVFDTDSVKLQSVTETNPKVVDSLNKKYNRERVLKEIPANTVSIISQLSSTGISQCESYINNLMSDYLK